jgi:peptidoglycan/xylan/chitin deacetylase (PgdA/CDA1 family)
MTPDILVVCFVLFLALLGIYISYAYWGPKEGIRILMYHKLDPTKSDVLTVSTTQFAQQINFLMQEGYSFLTFKDLIDAREKYAVLPDKSVLLTFDDGYQNNFEYVLPILKQEGIKATIFLPVDLIGKENEWDGGGEKLMDWKTLKKARPHFEYGLHSFRHQNLAEMTRDEFRQDLEECLNTLDRNELEVVPVLAYPYGRYPKSTQKFKDFVEVMDEFALQFALRIGNKQNEWPIKNRYLLCRIDVRGTDSFEKFKNKIANGKVKMF